MIYSESESEAGSNFAIKSVSDFDSHSDPESDSSSASMNLVIFVFFILYLHYSKYACGYFFNIMQAMQVYCLFPFGTLLPKKFVLITPSNSLALDFTCFSS